MDDWQRLVRNYGTLVYSAAWRVLRHREDVEDVVQEVFLGAWASRQREQVAQWGGWLRRMAVCRALDRLRSRRRWRVLDAEQPAPARSPVADAEGAELQEQLLACVAELPEQQREVFSLRYFELLTNGDIAEALGISESAVSTALHKARGNLARRLSSLIPGDHP
jgi:RNA polymerase sigma-70 factor (ECF subfamily)